MDGPQRGGNDNHRPMRSKRSSTKDARSFESDPDETDGRRIERARAEWRANADLIYVRRKVTYNHS